MKVMAQITHDNHYVPQFYLKQWSKDGHRIWAYRLLVSNEKVPIWERRSIRGIAIHRDLYTQLADGKETDDFERFLETEYESPAQEAINKVVQNKALTSGDWEKLARFFAAQDVRTPTNYLEELERWDETLPNILQTTLEDAVQQIEHSSGQTIIKTENKAEQFFKNLLKVHIVPNPDSSGGYISTEVVADRALWLESQRLLLRKTAQNLLKHKWSIAQPASGREWFTSDHPAVRLNYYGKEKYDLKGGWGNPGTDLLLPLSPYHLLYTNIGSESPDRFKLSIEHTALIQRIIAERALRWIYARKTIKEVVQFRPRHVDSVAFKLEEEQLRRWHKEQSEAENHN